MPSLDGQELARGARGVRRRSARRVAEAFGIAWLASAAACGGGAAAAAPPGTGFDPGAVANAPVDVATNANVERPSPALDEPSATGGWIGVSVLGGGVRFSRPARWRLRDASVEPGQSFVRYLSPDAYSFAIYERSDSPGKDWKDILEHYEADVAGNGAKALGGR